MPEGDVVLRTARRLDAALTLAEATFSQRRDIFTAEVRHVAPQDFPAGGVAALEVFKDIEKQPLVSKR